MKVLLINKLLSSGESVCRNLERFGHEVKHVNGQSLSCSQSGISVLITNERASFAHFDLILVEQSVSQFVVPFCSCSSIPTLIFNGRTQLNSNRALAFILSLEQMALVRSEQNKKLDYQLWYL